MQILAQVPVRVDLGQREVAEQSKPAVPGVRARNAEVVEHVGDQHGDHVGGHDAPNPVPRIAAQRGWRTAGVSRFHPWPEQQEPG